jgi:hypothetical protein
MRNRIRVRIRRLREPRYLMGLIAGVLYMYVFVFRGAFSGRGSGRSVLEQVARVSGPVQALGSVVLFLFAALAWLWPGSRPALLFTRAEVQFLFQAPLTRRQLVHRADSIAGGHDLGSDRHSSWRSGVAHGGGTFWLGCG